jgi:Ca-activated chloride channel family protein
MYRQDSALVVLLDLSLSMDAADLKPSRLIRAKQKLTDILRQRDEGQTALVAFAGSAFVVTPLTDDNDTILSQLQGLTTDIMPVQGGNIDAAIEKALLLLKQAGIEHGHALLLTDSEQYSESSVQQLTQAGHKLSVIGVGSQDGAPIAQSSGGFVTDNFGNIVIAKLDESALQRLALLGQGVYHAFAVNDSDIQAVLSHEMPKKWNKNDNADGDTGRQVSDQWQEEGVWLVLLTLPLFLMLFRRGLWVVMLVLWMQPAPSEAGVWQDMWQSKDKQGEALMQQQDFAQAQQTFKNPSWKAAAAYRNHDYAAAVEAFQAIEQPSVDDIYNYGNALAQLVEQGGEDALEKLDEAIAAYDKVLAQNPNHQDALANKALLEKKKQAQDEKNKKNKKENKQQQDKDGKESKDKQQKQDKDSQGQKQGDQKQGDQKGGEQKQGDQNQQDGEKSSEASQGSKQSQDKPQDSSQGQDQTKDDKASDKKSDEAQQAASQAEKDAKKQEDAAKKREQERLAQQKAKKEGKANEKQDAKPKIGQAEDDMQQQTPEQQAIEQTLRRIPDDPAGLLRRKFLYQYNQQAGGASNGRRTDRQGARGQLW